MTYEETKEIIDKVISDADKIPYYIDSESKVGKALVVAVESIERQIPKKPYNVNEDYLTFDCPTCLSALFSEDKLEYTSYCCKCGQAIDWSEEE